jgi:hypothetical protein
MGSESKDAGRAAISLRADQYHWLVQVLTTAARGGDVRVLMRHKSATVVLRAVSSGEARASSTVHLRKGPVRDSVAQHVLDDLRANGPSKAVDIARRLGAKRNTVDSALSYHRHEGRVARTGRVWCMAEQAQLSERKAAVR